MIAVAIEAAMLEDSMTSHDNALYHKLGDFGKRCFM